MKVPLLDLKAQYARIQDEVRVAVDRVLDSQQFILGPEVEALENTIAEYVGVEHAVGVSSGTDGLLAALMAFDTRPADEVITTPFSFFATAGVISRLQAIPVFVDIDPATFNLDPAHLAKAITSKTRAVIPVHLFGRCADMNAIQKAVLEPGIPIIEDAAQALGATLEGQKAGSLGEIGVFSFFPSKNLGAYGDGGMVVTRDGSLAEKIRLLRQHGSAKTYRHKYVGGNFRLDALQAAILHVKLKHLDEWSEARRANAAYYARRFNETDLAGDGLLVPPPAPSPESMTAFDRPTRHIFNQYTLRARDRDALRAYLEDHGIGTAIYYPVPLHLQECFVTLGYKPGDFPEAERVAAEVLSIPVYPELTFEQKKYVVQKITDFYHDRKA